MKFLADPSLGKLAKWLRILGFDTVYFGSGDKPLLLKRAETEQRILLTRDRRIRRKAENLPHLRCCFISHDRVKDQLSEFAQAFMVSSGTDRSVRDGFPPEKLGKGIHPFSRCLECNRELEPIEKEEAEGKVPEYVFSRQERFSRCPGCGKIYWEGTHIRNMMDTLDLLNPAMKRPPG